MINFKYKETFLTLWFANNWRRIETLKEGLDLCVLWSEDGDKRGKFGKKYNSPEGPKEKEILSVFVCFSAVTT